MAENSRVVAKSAANRGAIVSSTLGSGQNTHSMINEANLSNLNNEQMVQCIKNITGNPSNIKLERRPHSWLLE